MHTFKNTSINMHAYTGEKRKTYKRHNIKHRSRILHFSYEKYTSFLTYVHKHTQLHAHTHHTQLFYSFFSEILTFNNCSLLILEHFQYDNRSSVLVDVFQYNSRKVPKVNFKYLSLKPTF